jgi:hypothetical protein
VTKQPHVGTRSQKNRAVALIAGALLLVITLLAFNVFRIGQSAPMLTQPGHSPVFVKPTPAAVTDAPVPTVNPSISDEKVPLTTTADTNPPSAMADPLEGLPAPHFLTDQDMSAFRTYLPARKGSPQPPRDYQTAPQSPQSYPSPGSSAWYSDGCRYFQLRGHWVRDYCALPLGPASAGVVHALIVRPMYQSSSNATGTAVVDWSRPGFIAVRVPDDPLFQFVQWAAWPVADTHPSAEILYQVMVSNVPVWYSMSDLSSIYAGGQGKRIGITRYQSNSQASPFDSPWLTQLGEPTRSGVPTAVAIAIELSAVTAPTNCLAVRCPLK